MSILKRSTLAEQAYEELKTQIISGRRPPGQRLLAEDLAEELAISQTPIKEALALLERDGLVAGEARRGSVVRRFTTEDISEIYQARIMLELQALEIGMKAGRLTPDVVSEAEAIFEDLVRQIERDSNESLAIAVELDRKFHELLVSTCGNNLIIDWHRTVIRQIQTAANYSRKTYTLDRAGPGHQAIVDALKSGDVRNCIKILKAHLTGSRDEMLARAPDERPLKQ